MTHRSIRTLIQIALFAAILAIFSQISIPLPMGVPLTLQTFAVALTGYFLGAKHGTIAAGVFLALGAIGLPVFAGFTGGLGHLIGVTGGFLWGFLPMTFLCGIALSLPCRFPRPLAIILTILLNILALAICHLFGIIQFTLVTKSGFLTAFLTVSLPYLLKDTASLVAAYFLARLLRRLTRSFLP